MGQDKRVNSQMKRDEEIKGGILLTESLDSTKIRRYCKKERQRRRRRGRRKSVTTTQGRQLFLASFSA